MWGVWQEREEQVELPEGATLADLVGVLAGRNGRDFAARVVEGGKVHRFCWCLLNGQRVTDSTLSAALQDQDEVMLTTPLVVGG